MALPFFKWSLTAASNATADPTVNWAEGQAPSTVNDSARNMMASAAAYREDTAGLTTGGTSTAYTLTTNQVFDSLANMDGNELSFFVHATNGAAPTLNVDGLGAKALYVDGAGTVVPTGTLIAGACYTATYINSVSQWRLKDFYQLPFTVPVGGMIDYFGATSPNSNFVFPYGQAISRTTYSVLFALIGTAHGSGDGSTTFNLPDLRGRIAAGKDDMGGSAASRLTSTTMGPDGITLGAVGGAQTVTLAAAQIPAGVPSSGSNSISVTSTVSNVIQDAGDLTTNTSAGSVGRILRNTLTSGAITSTNGTQAIAVTSTNASQTAVNKVQPTIVCNKLLRII